MTWNAAASVESVYKRGVVVFRVAQYRRLFDGTFQTWTSPTDGDCAKATNMYNQNTEAMKLSVMKKTVTTLRELAKRLMLRGQREWHVYPMAILKTFNRSLLCLALALPLSWFQLG